MAPVRALLDAAVPEPLLANDGFPEGSVIDDSAPLTGRLDTVGKPANSHELVLSRLQDLTQLIAERHSLSAILLTALECLRTGFGYSRSILLLRDAGTPKMRARVWCGAITKAQADQLEIDIDSPGDLFAAAIRAVRICKSKTLSLRQSPRAFHSTSPKLVRRPPASYSPHPFREFAHRLHSGRSRPAGTEAISPGDMRLLRTVRGQIVLAMKTVR